MVPERKIRHRCIQTLGGASGKTANGFISTRPCSWAQVGIIRDPSFYSKFILFQQQGPLTFISALLRNTTHFIYHLQSVTAADPPCCTGLCLKQRGKLSFFQTDIGIPLTRKGKGKGKARDFSFRKRNPVQTFSRSLPHLRFSVTQLQMFQWIQECDLCLVSGEPLWK